MARALTSNPGDTIIQLDGDEYSALVALLFEFSDESKAEQLCDLGKLEFTAAQRKRISKLWSKLVQSSKS